MLILVIDLILWDTGVSMIVFGLNKLFVWEMRLRCMNVKDKEWILVLVMLKLIVFNCIVLQLKDLSKK